MKERIYGNVLFGADKLVSDWVAERLEYDEFHQNARALGVIREGNIVAGVVYYDFNQSNIFGAIAAVEGSRWADRGTLFRIFEYPFDQLRVNRITCVIAESNTKSMKLCTQMGFRFEARHEGAAHDGGAMISMRMFRDDCRWISNGKVESASTP
ncbi:MAG: GNAT family protein [Pseudomonadota bacterium]